MKVIVIGGVAAGMSAAGKIRRNRMDSEVVVYEKGSTLSYGACGLPYYVSNVIKDRNAMVARTADEFRSQGISINLFHEVTEVRPDSHEVVIRDLKTGEVKTDTYDKLVVTSGAAAVVPPWQGVDLGNIFVLSNLEDGDAIKQAAHHSDVRSVAVIGAGFIGVELVESFLEIGKHVTLIELQNQILPGFDKEVVQPLQEELERKGAVLKLGEKVEHFTGSGRVERVVTSVNSYAADLVVVAVGVRPSTSFLDGTGVERLRNGAVVVDRNMRSSDPDIFAGGDCATVYHKVLVRTDSYIPLGTNANKQGRMIGDIITGVPVDYQGTLGTAMIKVCEYEAAKTGITEKEALMNNIPYKAVSVKAGSHAAYYPDAQPTFIKLITSPESKKVLGAQVVGKEGAALRADIFAMAVHTGMTAPELGYVDFGYSPPFAGVWDAVGVAANRVK